MMMKFNNRHPRKALTHPILHPNTFQSTLRFRCHHQISHDKTHTLRVEPEASSKWWNLAGIYLLQGRTPTLVRIRCHLDLHIGEVVLRKMAKAPHLREPNFPSPSVIRHIVQKNYGSRVTSKTAVPEDVGRLTNDVFYDGLEAEEANADINIKEQITSRTTKPIQQDNHYPTASRRLVKGLVKG